MIKISSVALQYGMLIALLLFLLRIVGFMRYDLRGISRQLRKTAAAPKGALLEVAAAGDDSLVGTRFAVSGELSIGRAADNDIVLNDNYVSHHHAIVMRRKNLYVIEDLGSVNHTYVNDKELKGRAYLKPGDTIRIGLATLVFGGESHAKGT